MKTYLVPDINKKYTDVISGYMNKGYIIYTNTMGGSQGEKAGVHLLAPDKKTVLRITLDNFRRTDDLYAHGYEIKVRSYPTANFYHRYDLDSMNDILWEENGTEITSIPFYQISDSKQKFYGDLEAYQKAQAVRLKRLYGPKADLITDRTHYQKDITSPEVIKTVMPWVKKQYKCTSAIPRDVNCVRKCIDYRMKNGTLVAHPYYEVVVRHVVHKLGMRQHLWG